MDIVASKPFTDLLQDLIDEVLENHGQGSTIDLRELKRVDSNAIA